MKIGLVNPKYPAEYRWAPLGLGYLASNIENPESYDVRIFDLNWISEAQFFQALHAFRPDLLGFYSQTAQFPAVLKLIDAAKKLVNPRVVLGGPHVTGCGHLEGRDLIDDFVIGEGETVFSQIVNGKLAPGIHQSVFRPSLDSLNFPAYDKMAAGLFQSGYQGMITSRGCPYNCLFCQPTLRKLFGSKTRKRSPENVIAEMWLLYRQFKIRRIKFQDDTFTFSRNWVFDFCEKLCSSGPPMLWDANSRVNTIDQDMVQAMRAAGCVRLSFGIESGSQAILSYYRKGITPDDVVEAFAFCKKAGVKTHAYVIVGAPAETPETILETERLIEKIRPDSIFVTHLTPVPGTDLYDQLLKSGSLNPDFACDNADYSKGYLSFKHDHMSSEQLNRARRHMMRSFYRAKLLQPSFLIRALSDYPFTFIKHKLRWLLKGA